MQAPANRPLPPVKKTEAVVGVVAEGEAGAGAVDGANAPTMRRLPAKVRRKEKHRRRHRRPMIAHSP